MSVDLLRKEIERHGRNIEAIKIKIANCKEEISKIRIKKSRSSDNYSNRLKSASSASNKDSIRKQKQRDWERYANLIESEKGKILKYKDKIQFFRERIKNCRERIKRLK